MCAASRLRAGEEAAERRGRVSSLFIAGGLSAIPAAVLCLTDASFLVVEVLALQETLASDQNFSVFVAALSAEKQQLRQRWAALAQAGEAGGDGAGGAAAGTEASVAGSGLTGTPRRPGLAQLRHAVSNLSASTPGASPRPGLGRAHRQVFEALGQEQLFPALRNVVGRAQLDEAQTEAFLNALREERFAPGELIVRQGDKADKLFVIVEGEARVTQTVEEGAKGGGGDVPEERDLGAGLFAGSVIGEIALVKNKPRNANVRAVGHVVCVSLSAVDFRSMAAADRKFLDVVRAIAAEKEVVRARRGSQRGARAGTVLVKAAAPTSVRVTQSVSKKATEVRRCVRVHA